MPIVAQSDLVALGKAVRKARILKGLSLKKLGYQALGTDQSQGQLSKIENGIRQISPLTAGKLVDFLKLPESLLDPFLAEGVPEEDEVTTADRHAEQLIRLAEKDSTAPETAETLLIQLADEFARGKYLDVWTAYKDLKGALQAAASIKARGELPQNVDDQLQLVMKEVARLNDLGLREEAADALDEAEKRVDAEREAIFHLQLDQDRVLNRPEAAADRIIRNLMQSAPPGGVWNATRGLLQEWLERGRRLGKAFDLQVALSLGKRNWSRAKGPRKAIALDDVARSMMSIGQRSSNEYYLRTAVKICRQLLGLFSKQTDAEQWALIQNRLGDALQDLGERTKDPGLLRDALVTFETSLIICTREKMPDAWANCQNNLGSVLQKLGELESDSDFLTRAKTLHQDALTIWTREKFARDWAMSQNNLGLTLRWLGTFEQDVAQLEGAKGAFLLSLQETAQEEEAFFWAGTQWNLADLALAHHELEPDPKLLIKAREHVLAAREVFADGSDYQTARCDELLARIEALSA